MLNHESNADIATIHRILQADPTWAAYAIADLQPAFAPYCQWTVGQSEAGEGLVLLFTMLDPPILLTVGPADAIAVALAQATLPDHVFISAQEAHYPPLTRFYDFTDRIKHMWRMTPTGPRSPIATPLAGLVRLTLADGERLSALYDHGGEFAPDFFHPYQLRDGVYFGVAGETGELLAAGGTHILDRHSGVAAIGNIYTRPDQRGQGYGSAVFQAVATTLIEENYSNIFLNVNQRNTTACQLYQRYGFEIYCPFLEGEGIKRTA